MGRLHYFLVVLAGDAIQHIQKLRRELDDGEELAVKAHSNGYTHGLSERRGPGDLKSGRVKTRHFHLE